MMVDGVKISKDKRHRSCCSVAAPADGVRSERKLDARASIAEVNDKFCNAETRCDQLQQKINMIKYLKKKKKLKRRSTRAEALEAADNSPVISVQTKLKRKSTVRVEERGAAAGGKASTTTVRAEDNREAVPAARGSASAAPATRRPQPELRRRAGGDAAASVRGVESVCGADHTRLIRTPPGVAGGTARCVVNIDVAEKMEQAKPPRAAASATRDHRQDISQTKDKAVVELFGRRASQASTVVMAGGATQTPATDAVRESWRARARHYEAATVVSCTRRTSRVPLRRRLPFVISSTVAPSHNLAVNLQKLLNSLKIQQPPRGIPPTLAHHLGLDNLPNYVSSSALVAGRGARGAASVGRSYARALALLRAGDGPLPRYLRSLHMISSRKEDVYNWATNDYATEEAKRKLAEYAQLYRELERVDERLGKRLGKGLGERRDPALELRRRQLVALLKAREGKVSDIVRKYEDESTQSVHVSASSVESSFYRHSQFKLNVG